MSVQSAAAHARTSRVGRAEQMVRTATSTLSAYPVVQRVGAASAALAVAEQLLVGALAELRAVQHELAALGGDPQDAAPEPRATVPVVTVAHPGLPTPGPASRPVTPLTVRPSARGLDVVR